MSVSHLHKRLLRIALKARQSGDDAKALELLRILAGQEVADAQRILGDMLRACRGIPPDKSSHNAAQAEKRRWWERAVTNYRKAAEQGDAQAQYWLGMMLRRGRGVWPRMEIAGTRWLWRAARGGNADAMFALAEICEEASKDRPSRLAEAVRLCRRAAGKGHPDAGVMMGRLYAEGKGLPRDYRRAIALLLKPGKNGNADARYWLGVSFMEASGADKNLRRATYWLRRVPVSRRLSHEAYLRLGILFCQGHTRPKDYMEAYAWYLAARWGNLAEASQSLRKWIVGVFRRAVPRNSQAFVFVQLLDSVWERDDSLAAEIARRLVMQASGADGNDGKHESLGHGGWVLAACVKALWPLRELAWDADFQRQEVEFRRSVIGAIKGSLPVPEGGFLRGVKTAVISRMQAILWFAARFQEDYRGLLGRQPFGLDSAAIESLGAAWIPASTQFVADGDRPYRAAPDIEGLECAVFQGELRDVHLSPLPTTAEQGREACRIEGSSWVLQRYYDFIHSAETLVARGVLTRGDLEALLRVGPQARSGGS